MTTTSYLLAFLIGVVAGLRTMTAPASVSWAAQLGRLHLGHTRLALLGYAWTPWLLSLLAVGELIVDQLPSTPSRTVPLGLGARIVTGALSGAAIGTSGDMMIGGMLAGIVGAVIGTFGGHAFRVRLAARLHHDRPAAFIEDAIAIGGALVIGMGLPVHAHHSIAGLYDAAQPVTVEGTLTTFYFVNPHPYVEIQVADPDGQMQSWRLELDNLRELSAVGMSATTLRAGDRLVVTGSRARNQSRSLYVRSLQRPADGFLYEQVGTSPRVRFPSR